MQVPQQSPDLSTLPQVTDQGNKLGTRSLMAMLKLNGNAARQDCSSNEDLDLGCNGRSLTWLSPGHGN